MHILCKYQSTFRAKLRKHVLYRIFNIKQNHFLFNMKCSIDKLKNLREYGIRTFYMRWIMSGLGLRVSL